jgi:hypothetical protein
MESKKKRVKPEDHEMGSTTTDDVHPLKGERRIAKGKRRAKDSNPIIDEETGEAIEYEDDSSDLDEDKNAIYMDEQEVVQQESDEDGVIVENDDNDDWGDINDDSAMKEEKKKKKTSK